MPNNQQDIHTRIKQTIKWLIGNGIAKNQETLGILLGYSNKSSFSQIINGHTDLPNNFINKLTQLDSRLNFVWLKDGSGSMLINSSEPSNLEDTNLNSNVMNESQVQKLFEMFESQQKVILGLVDSNQKLVEANQKLADASLIHARSVEVIIKRIEFDETNTDETDLDKVKKSQAS